MRWSVVILLCLGSALALAQDESGLAGDFRREQDRIHDACGTFALKTVAGCGIELFTDHPLHIAAGSMPPQNGFGLGVAFVASKNTRNWRLSWDVDAVAAISGAWRAGGYMKMVHTPAVKIKAIDPTADDQASPSPKKPKKPTLKVHPYTIFNLYAQSISLNKLNFFGEGNDTSLAGASVFGMNQTIVGGSVIKPVFAWRAISKLNLALLGEVNGRFIDIRGEHDQSVPSIEAVYNNATAPRLGSQPGYVQLGEGVRIKPLIGNYVQLDYLANFQQFFAPANSQQSFMRWTVDLTHTISLYGHTQSGSNNSEANGPDECAAASATCLPVSYSRNLNGSVGLRFLLSESITSGSSIVPFYFQPTLGGSDIDGAAALASYRDYRFRAPNLMLFRESFEHSIWGPFGFEFMADQGKVAIARGDLDFDDLKHSFASGITLRAGGFPMVSLLFAWGSSEGHHTIANVNTSLLGGSQRPSLY